MTFKILEGTRQEGSQSEQKHGEYYLKFEHYLKSRINHSCHYQSIYLVPCVMIKQLQIVNKHPKHDKAFQKIQQLKINV